MSTKLPTPKQVNIVTEYTTNTTHSVVVTLFYLDVVWK